MGIIINHYKDPYETTVISENSSPRQPGGFGSLGRFENTSVPWLKAWNIYIMCDTYGSYRMYYR